MQSFDDGSGQPLSSYGSVEQQHQEEARGGGCRRFLFLAKVIAVIALLFGGVAGVMYGFLDVIRLMAPAPPPTSTAGSSSTTQPGENEFLRANDRIQFPSDVLSSLNSSVDPCEDFYEYACGGWKPNVPIPSYQSSWDKQWHSVIKDVEEATTRESCGKMQPKTHATLMLSCCCMFVLLVFSYITPCRTVGKGQRPCGRVLPGMSGFEFYTEAGSDAARAVAQKC